MNELVKFDQVKADMAAFKKENENLVFDYEDPQGNKDARSHIFKLRKIKTVIADIHKETKAVALGVCKLLDREKRELTGQVDEWIDVHYKPVKEIEEREAKAASVQANNERLERIRVEAERAAEIEKREDELVAREAAAKEKESALVREQEKLEAAKQAEIDKGIAVRDAQDQAERDKIEATAKAEQDKIACVQHELDAERERFRRKDEAVQAEMDRLAEIEAKRVANESHRMKIEDEIRDAVDEIIRVASEIGTGGSDEITSALINNEIPHITINY